jgi:hypothetical protein
VSLEFDPLYYERRHQVPGGLWGCCVPAPEIVDALPLARHCMAESEITLFGPSIIYNFDGWDTVWFQTHVYPKSPGYQGSKAVTIASTSLSMATQLEPKKGLKRELKKAGDNDILFVLNPTDQSDHLFKSLISLPSRFKSLTCVFIFDKLFPRSLTRVISEEEYHTRKETMKQMLREQLSEALVFEINPDVREESRAMLSEVVSHHLKQKKKTSLFSKIVPDIFSSLQEKPMAVKIITL